MAQPTAYTQQHDYSDYQSSNPGEPMNGAQLDDDFQAIVTTLDGVLTALAILQADDTSLNRVVDPDSLTTATLALISTDWSYQGDWATSTAYAVGDVVTNSDAVYVCTTAHTSGTFSTDKTSGYWVTLVSNSAAADVSYDGSSSGLSATTVQDAIDELTTAASKALKALTPAADKAPYFTSGSAASLMSVTAAARTVLDDASVSAMRTTLAAAGTGDANVFTATQSWAKGADVASPAGGNLTLGSDGNYFDITGTNTITSIDTVGVGTEVLLQFDAALTLTHHATALVLPGGTDITTAAGDHALFVEYATGDWRCVDYFSAPMTQAQAEAGTDTLPRRVAAEQIAQAIDAKSQIALYQNQQTSGTGGPTFSASSWQTFAITTEVYDVDGIGSLSANQITLGAGTYRVWAMADPGKSGTNDTRLRARLYNATDTAVIEQGINAQGASGTGDGPSIFVISQFTLAGSKAIELQVYPSAATTSSTAMTTGEVEVFASILIEKVA